MSQYTNKIQYLCDFFCHRYGLTVLFAETSTVCKNYTHDVYINFDNFQVCVCSLEADWVEWELRYAIRFIETAIYNEFKRTESILNSYARCIMVLTESLSINEPLSDEDRLDEINNSFIMQRFTRRL